LNHYRYILLKITFSIEEVEDAVGLLLVKQTILLTISKPNRKLCQGAAVNRDQTGL